MEVFCPNCGAQLINGVCPVCSQNQQQMFCRTCGYDMPDGVTVCPICNTPVINQVQQNMVTNVEKNIYNPNVKIRKKTFKWKILLLCVLGIVLFAGGIIIGKKIEKSHNSGRKEDGKQDVTNETMHATATDATETEAELDTVVETTEEITTETIPAEPIEIAISQVPELEKLKSFLDHYERYGTYINMDFDSENPTCDILGYLMDPECAIAEVTMAPKYEIEEHPDENYGDPQGKLQYSYLKIRVDGIDWIEKNVFNMSDEAVQRVRESYFQLYDDVYELDGYYYAQYDPVNGGIYYGSYNNIVNVKYDGTYYYITVDDYDGFEYEKNGNSIANLVPWKSRYELKMELKEVDGVTFWSLHNCHSLSAEWARAYYECFHDGEISFDGMDSMLDMGNAFVSAVYIDGDNIPELVYESCMYAGSGSFVLSYHNGEVMYDQPGFGFLDYIENENLFYRGGGTGGMGCIWEELCKIDNGQVVRIGSKCEYTNEDGKIVYSWDGQEVTEEEYNRLLSENFDFGIAKDIYDSKIANITSVDELCNWLLFQYE